MDNTLLTTVEQLSDDAPNSRGAGWPAGSVLASSPQSGQAGLASAVQNGVREDRSGAADPHERSVYMQWDIHVPWVTYLARLFCLSSNHSLLHL